MKAVCFLVFLVCFLLASADVFELRGLKVSNYQVVQPYMTDKKRSVLQNGVDTRISSKTRSTQGHYLHKRNVQVAIEIDGTEHILDMQLNENIIHPNYQVIYGNSDGSRTIVYGAENCYYVGSVEGVSSSFVAVSTCNQQLEGTILVDDKYYTVVPKPVTGNKERSENEHVVYNEDSVDQNAPTCGNGEYQLSLNSHLQEEVTVEKKHSDTKAKRGNKYLELLVVNDYARVTSFGNNTALQINSVNIFNIVNQAYNEGVFPAVDGLLVISLIGQYIPSQEEWVANQPSQPDASTLLNNFTSWRNEKLGKTTDAVGVNDNAHLLSGRDFTSSSGSSVAGLAWVGTICSGSSTGIGEASAKSSITTSAYIIAHELGHNFGSNHDGDGNSCASNKFLMAPIVCVGCKWSTCSLDVINSNIPDYTCLNNAPTTDICGDFVKNSDEQCDFGKSGTTCCSGTSSPTPCQWINSATCDNSSPCCKNCQLLSEGTKCRNSTTDPCDDTDYCSADGSCLDKKRPDGYSCGTDSNCFSGSCNNRNLMCSNFDGYIFTIGGAKISGPFTPCDTTCAVKCKGSNSNTCIDMSTFGQFSNSDKLISVGITCGCTGGKVGVCTGSSTTCDCTNATLPTTAPTTSPTTTTSSLTPTPTSTPTNQSGNNNSSGSISSPNSNTFISLLVGFFVSFYLFF